MHSDKTEKRGREYLQNVSRFVDSNHVCRSPIKQDWSITHTCMTSAVCTLDIAYISKLEFVLGNARPSIRHFVWHKLLISTILLLRVQISSSHFRQQIIRKNTIFGCRKQLKSVYRKSNKWYRERSQKYAERNVQVSRSLTSIDIWVRVVQAYWNVFKWRLNRKCVKSMHQ